MTRKRFLTMMLVLTVAFGTCGAALAAEEQGTAVKEGLKSYGKITYQDGKDQVVIDSQDFYKLEERINLFKQGVTNQLNEMNTYFTTGEGVSVQTDADIRVAHTAPSGECAVDPVSLDFGTILEGVAASQSVPSDVTAYGYPAGTALYKNADGALTSDSPQKGAEQISVTAASAKNLSAGTAAWVDGKLILGTGEDNKSYYENNKELKTSRGAFTVYGHGSTATVTLGQRPRTVVLYGCRTGHGGWTLAQFQIYDSVNNLQYRYMMKSIEGSEYGYASDIKITDNGFTYTQNLGASDDTILSSAELNYYVIY